jgi:hypothetical protein
VKAGSEQNGRQYLAGATLDNWHASPLTGDLETGLPAWSKDEIVEFLRTGRTPRVAAFGVMAEVVGKSTQYLTDQDLIAIAEYLKSLPPSNYEGQGNADSSMQASAASAATRALRAGDTGDAWIARLSGQLQRLPSLGRVRRKPDLPEPDEKRSGQRERPDLTDSPSAGWVIHAVNANCPVRVRHA